MVNLYKLTNLLESGMTIFQLNQWKNEGIWYPITQYKKESNEIEVVTNVFTPLSEENPRFHIQLSANYDTEKAEWNHRHGRRGIRRRGRKYSFQIHTRHRGLLRNRTYRDSKTYINQI